MPGAREYATLPSPISASDVMPLTREFLRRWSVKRLARVGLHQHIAEILGGMLDNGEYLLPSVKELEKLTDFLNESGATDRAFDGDNVMSPELRSVIKKIHFAWGRCFGLTNYDMGIADD